jgi:hypothetical protein
MIGVLLVKERGTTMKKRVSLLVFAGIVVFSMVGVVSAQRQQPGRPGAGMRQEPLLRQVMQIIAGDLGIAPADILVQLQDHTLAEVIEANGGSVDDLSAAVTEAITAHVNTALEQGVITQARADQIFADLAANVESAFNGDLSALQLRILRDLRQPGFDGGRAPGSHFPHLNWGWNNTRPLLNAAVDATGLTAQEIAQAVRDGSTLGEVITANGGDPAAVIQSALATVQTSLDEAVTNGRVTQAQADAMLAGVQAFYEAAMNNAFGQNAEAVDAAV